MTAPGGFTAGDVLTAADMNTLPAGIIARAVVTSNQANITTLVDLTNLTVTFTAVSGRLYRVSAVTLMHTPGDSGAASQPLVYIRTSAGTYLQTAWQAGNVAVGDYATLAPSVLWTGSGATTLKLSAVDNLGGGGKTALVAAATTPAYLLVEDLGVSP